MKGKAKIKAHDQMKYFILFCAAVVLVQSLIYIISINSSEMFKRISYDAEMNLQNAALKQSVVLKRTLGEFTDMSDEIKSADVILSKILKERGITIEGFLTDPGAQTMFTEDYAEEMIDYMEDKSPSGVFTILCNDPENINNSNLKGFFFKDADPDGNDDLDSVMTRGSKAISTQYGIPLDINWSSDFEYKNTTSNQFKFFLEPVTAARSCPDRKSSDFGYWSDSFVYDDGSDERIITFSVPLIYEKTVYGVIGITLSSSKVSNMLKMDTFDGGIILLSSKNYSKGEDLIGLIQAVNGIQSVKKVNPGSQIKLTREDNSGVVYSADSFELDDGKPCCAAAVVSLYGNNAYFGENDWYVVSVKGRNSVYSAYEYTLKRLNITMTIIFATGAAAIIIVSFTALKRFAGFRDAVIGICESGRPEKEYSSKNEDLTELYELFSNMAEERREALLTYEGEHELCSIALKSSNSSLFEYENEEDLFMIYHFDEDNKSCFSRRSMFRNFRKLVMEGEVCPEEDINTIIAFLDGQMNEPFRARFYTKNKEIRWNYVSGKAIIDNNEVARVVACAQNITDIVLEEQRLQALSSRDKVTGFYEADYGYMLAKKQALENDGRFALAIVSLKNVNEFIRSEGSYYFNGVMEEIANILRSFESEGDILWRMSVSDIAIYIPNKAEKEYTETLNNALSYIDRVYFSESDPSIICGIGIFRGGKGEQFAEAVDNARLASLATEMPSYSRVTYYSDAQFDLSVRSKLTNAASYESSAGITELENGYNTTENMVSYTINMLEKSKNLTKAIDIIFCKIGRVLDLERIAFFDMNRERKSVRVFRQWSSYGKKKIIDSAFSLDSGFDELVELLSAGENVLADKNFYVSSNELSAFIAMLRENGKLLITPVFYHGVPYAFLVFCAVEREAPEGAIKSMAELSRVISAQVISSRTASENVARSEFFSKMSHEIRTPMNAVMGITQILLDSGDLSAETRDYVEKIDSSSHYLLELINSNLELSKIESGKMTVNSVPFDLQTLIDDTETIIRVQTEQKGLYFAVEGTIKHRYVFGDSLKLRQVLINILGNALKFTSHGGITLTVNEEGADNLTVDLHFSVKDMGIGISHENIEKIFDSFEQLGGKITAKYGGTGLGLAISSAYVSMMGGKLSVESELGKGSEFYFDIKLPIADKSKVETEEAENSEVVIAGRRILLAEDDEMNRMIAVKLLENDGLIVETAENGEIAVQKFANSEEKHFDAIFMDIRMPIMDGLEATKKIRSLDRSDARTVPIVALTANAFDEDMKKSAQCGMNGHLSKPIDIKQIRKILRATLRK
ncbi:MAG: ATP-binding protein [Oscillospiraceae bacterium]